jgi:hypothetical protein
VSTLNRSLVLEEIKESVIDLDDLFSLRHLSISNHSTDAQTAHQVVKVSGNITVSF